MGVPKEYIEFMEKLNRSVPDPIVEDQILKKGNNEVIRQGREMEEIDFLKYQPDTKYHMKM